MDIEFNSLKELYERLIPALESKVAELKRMNLNYIKKEDIWNYLKESIWINSKNLLLYQMVDDILNLKNIEIDTYVKNKIKNEVVQPDLNKMKWDDDYGKEN